MELRIPFLYEIQRIGISGVDMFLLLSGIGIFFSVTGNSTKDYFVKRILRIIPVFLPLVLFIGIFKVFMYDTVDSSLIWYNLFIFFTIWPDIPCLFWYIPCAMLLYAISPFFYRFFKKKPLLSVICISAISVLVTALLVWMKSYDYLVFTTRIPIYFVGFYIGYLIKEGRSELTNKMQILAFCIMLLGFVVVFVSMILLTPAELRHTTLRWYPFLITTAPLCFFLAKIMDMFKTYSFPILSFVGKYSLSIYTLHESILEIITWSMPVYRPIKQILAILCAFALAYLWENFVSKIIAKFTKNKNLLPTSYLSQK